MSDKQEMEEAKAKAKALYESGELEINGRIYELLKMRHEKRLEVFAFHSEVGKEFSQGNFRALVAPQYKHAIKTMMENIMFDGMQISKIDGHWEDYPEDYLELVGTAMGVMSYPFIRGSNIGSQSQGAKKQKTTSKKPM